MNNQYWLQAETNDELSEMLDMFWGFHDFRIEAIGYSSSGDKIDLLLAYDTQEFCILLSFIGNVSMNFVATRDYEADWLMGALLGRNKHNQTVWTGADDDDIDINELPNDVLWIAGDRLHYLFLDHAGQAQQIPEEMIHQVCKRYNFETGKYDHIEKEFHPRYCLSTGDMPDV